MMVSVCSRSLSRGVLSDFRRRVKVISARLAADGIFHPAPIRQNWSDHLPAGATGNTRFGGVDFPRMEDALARLTRTCNNFANRRRPADGGKPC